MPRYVAFLRGVSPLNAKMADLRGCFENAGFTNVATVLSSGNVIFNAPTSKNATLEKKAEAAMRRELGHSFRSIVRPISHLKNLLATDPYAEFGVAPTAKRVVTFLHKPTSPKQSLPIEADGVQVLCVVGLEVFTAYTPGEKGPVFMSLIEKTFGKGVTTRTLETVKKCVLA